LRAIAVCLSGLMAAGVCVVAGDAWSMTDGPADLRKGPQLAAAGPDAAFEDFLDRLMRAESNGQDYAANPRSTALGPFQFIKSTFIEVVRRHFAAEVAILSDDAVLALRTNRAFARRAAGAFCKDNLAFLSGQGLNPTFGHLRLAFLVGPSAAVRVLQAAPATSVAEILGDSVIVANPFMRGMTAADLIARTAREVASDRQVRPGGVAARAKPGPQPSDTRVATVVAVCNPKLASCRAWIALRTAALERQKATSRNTASGKRDPRRRVSSIRATSLHPTDPSWLGRSRTARRGWTAHSDRPSP